jgi:hypothetical protein
MYIMGWLTPVAAILVLDVLGTGPAVVVLMVGSAAVLLQLRAILDRPERSPRPTAPRSVNIEADQIGRFQQSLDERGAHRDQ